MADEEPSGRGAARRRTNARAQLANMPSAPSNRDGLIPATPQETRGALWQDPDTGKWKALRVPESTLLSGMREGTLTDAGANEETQRLFEALDQEQTSTYLDAVDPGFGDLKGFGEATLSGLTAGVHRHVPGLYDQETKARYEQWVEENPGLAGTGNAIGFLVPMLLTFGGSAEASTALAALKGTTSTTARLASQGRTILSGVSGTRVGKALSLGTGGLTVRGAKAIGKATGVGTEGLAYNVLEGGVGSVATALQATLDSAEPEWEEFGRNLAVHGALGVAVPVVLQGVAAASGSVRAGGRRLLGRTADNPATERMQQRAKTIPEDPEAQSAFRDELLEKAWAGDAEGVTNYLNRLLQDGTPSDAAQAKRLLQALGTGRNIGRAQPMDAEAVKFTDEMVDEVFVPLLKAQYMARFGDDALDAAGVAQLTTKPGTRLNGTLQADPVQVGASFKETMLGVAEDLATLANDRQGTGPWAKSALRNLLGAEELPMIRAGKFDKINISELLAQVALNADAVISSSGRAVIPGKGAPRFLRGFEQGTAKAGKVEYPVVNVQLAEEGAEATTTVRVSYSKTKDAWTYKPRKGGEKVTLKKGSAEPTWEQIDESFTASGAYTQDIVAEAAKVAKRGKMGELAEDVFGQLDANNAPGAFAAVEAASKSVGRWLLPKESKAIGLNVKLTAQEKMEGFARNGAAWGQTFVEQAQLTREAYGRLITQSTTSPPGVRGFTSKQLMPAGEVDREAVFRAVQGGLFGTSGANGMAPNSAALMKWVGGMLRDTSQLLAVRGGDDMAAEALAAAAKEQAEGLAPILIKAAKGVAKRRDQLEVLDAANQLSYAVPGARRSQSWQRAVGMAVLGVPGMAARALLGYQAGYLLGAPPTRVLGSIAKEAVLDFGTGMWSKMAGSAVKEKTARTAASSQMRTFRSVDAAEKVIGGEPLRTVGDFRRAVGTDRWVLGLVRAPAGKRLADEWGPGEPSLEERFEEVSTAMREVSGSPQGMLLGLSAMTESLYDADPTGELAGSYGDTVSAALGYAIEQMPNVVVDPLTGEALPPAKAAIKEWFHCLDALHDPNVICEYVATGLVKQSGVQAVREAYPQQFAQYVLAFAQKALATGSKLTYAQKLILGEVTGMNLDPTEESSFIMAMNQDYSQTPEQSAALGQVAAMQAQGNAQAVAFAQAARRLPGSTASTAQKHRSDLERLGQT